MSLAAEKQTKETKIGERARLALQNANGDVHAAARILEKQVRSSRALRDELTEPLIASACLSAVSLQHRAARSRIWNGGRAPATAETQTTDHANRVRLLAFGTLMMFPLADGTSLGDATRAQVQSCAEMYRTKADDMDVKARWLGLVAQSVPAGKLVKDVLSEARLRELQTEARANG